MTVKQISPEQTYRLRHLVLWPHILKESDCVIDIDRDPDAIHLGGFDNEKLVSVGSLFKVSSPKLTEQFQYRLRAMASDPDYRGKEFGKRLIEHAILVLKSKKVDVLWCDARIKAAGFYEKCGFTRKEEIYHIPKIGPHQFMWINFSYDYSE